MIHVYSREQIKPRAQMSLDIAMSLIAEGWEPPPVISISQPGNPLIWNPDIYKKVLYLEFDDVVEPRADQPDLVLFNEEMAEKLKAFLSQWRFWDTFVAHCHAGISRSVAAGVYVDEVLNIGLALYATPDISKANGLMLRLLRRAQWEETLNRKENS